MTILRGLIEAKNACPNPSVYAWNSFISADAKFGNCENALKLYDEMHQKGIKSDNGTLSCILKACASRGDIRKGRLIHDSIIGSGLELDVIVGNTLVDMYAKCESLEEARQVFDNMPNRDVMSWGAMISGYAVQGLGLPALELFEKMQQDGIKPNKVIFLSILKACGRIQDIRRARLVYDQIIQSGLKSDVMVGSALVDMFVKCNSFVDAHRLFDELPVRNVVCWSALIAGYTNHGQGYLALELFKNMHQQGMQPHSYIFSSILKACGNIEDIEDGRFIHDQIIRCGHELDVVLGNSLVDMYAGCGRLHEARKMFDDLPQQNLISWGTIIAGYLRHWHDLPALELLQIMQQKAIRPSKNVILYIFKACRNIEQGRLIHDQVVRSGLQSDVVIGSAIVDTYAKCGNLDEACQMFDKLPNHNLVSWGAIIAGCVQHGHDLAAFKLFQNMQEEGMKPDAVIFSCTLKACGSMKALEQGRLIHDQITRCHFELDAILGNSLVDMYVKCGNLDEAQKVFDELPSRDVVSYSAMITGFATQELAPAAFELYTQMQVEGIRADKFTYSCILKACSSIGAINQGRLMHNRIIRCGSEADDVIANALVDMYAKCGSIQEAGKTLHRLQNRNVQSWGAMIAGPSQYGYCSRAEQCFQELQQPGLKPDNVTFTSILAACSHAGLLGEGQHYFRLMRESHGIMPDYKHYSCLVDLLGRAGVLYEADDLLRTMPTPPDVILWTSLLSSCRTYGNINLGKTCFYEVLLLDSRDASGYTLMSSIYADAHMWQDVEKIQELRKIALAWKKAGRAWIDVNTVFQDFIVAENSLQQNVEISAKLCRLNRSMEEEGRIPLMSMA